MKLLKKIYWIIVDFGIYMIINWILPFIMFLHPVKKNKIVFFSYNGQGFNGNCKYIAEEILRRKLPWDLVWLVNDLNEEIPEGIRKVKNSAPEQFYEVGTAKVIITNIKCGLHLMKKKNQYMIQTWHGSCGSKLVEKDAEDKLAPAYVKASKINSRQTDLFLSNSAAMTQLLKDAFWCESEIMECGFPRNDAFFSFTEEKVKSIKAALGVGPDTKLVLYAPTFRDDGKMDVYNLDCMALLEKLSAKGGDWRLLTRLHPNIADKENPFPQNEYIINATPYPDMQDLLIAADILITDYSGTPPEFAIMGKQIYIYAPDLAEYQALRGLRKDFFTSPYRINETNEALLELVEQYSPETAAEQARAYMEYTGGIDKGVASKCVVDRLVEVIGKC